MKLTLATPMALMVAVARAAPVPGDNPENTNNALIDAEVLDDSVKNVGNNALSGLVDELSGLLDQLTGALGGLLKRGDDAETTDNALIKAGVANDAVKDILNNAAKRDENLLGLGDGNRHDDDDNLLGLPKRGDDAEATDNALVKAGVANDAVKDVLNNAAKRDKGLLGDLLDKRDEAIDDNALVKVGVANNAVKDVLNDLAKRGDNTETKNNTLIKLSILNNALKNLLNNLL